MIQPVAIGEACIIVSAEHGMVCGSFPDTKSELGYTSFKLSPADAIKLGELLLKHGRKMNPNKIEGPEAQPGPSATPRRLP